MYILLIILLLHINPNRGLERHRRNAIDMGTMIERKIHRNSLIFVNYGNYCGLKNPGGRPINDLDKCCEKHDSCYGEVQKKCEGPHPATYDYKWTVNSNNTIICESIHNSQCPEETCECDRLLSRCLSQYINEYNSTQTS